MVATIRHAWARLRTIFRPLFVSEQRLPTLGLFAALVGLLLIVTWLNVRNSYINNYFMTALADGHAEAFMRLILQYAGIFVVVAVVAAGQRYFEERLGLKMREDLTRHVMQRYLTDHAYHRLVQRDDIDNPDQRIAEDIKSFTANSLSFALIVLNSTINLVSFAGVLWSISPRLVLAAMLYAAFGTVGSVLLGRKLVPLNFLQLKKEADFRFQLIQVREKDEAIALQGAEARELSRLGDRLTKVVENFVRIILVDLRLNIFVNSFNYLTQIVPVLVVAPLFFSHEVSFGAITQSMAAFAFVLNAFTVIVTQFQQITSLAAVTERLGALMASIEDRPENVPELVASDKGRIAFEGITLWTPHTRSPLIKELTLELPPKQRLLVAGSDRESRAALFQAVAGLWEWGEGKIVRPVNDEIQFLPRTPFLTPCSLRDQVTAGLPGDRFTDVEITQVLEQVGFKDLMARLGGLNAERDWPNELTASEQRLLGFARLFLSKPKVAVIDAGPDGLTSSIIRSLYRRLSETTIDYVSFGDHSALREFHDVVLELDGNGIWNVESRHR